ncbi:hypothetical protein [Siphonobacter sp. SORGH_AS_1065]|uniref:hypothetical protein n=1 Tax=Siphonobacter sp. SORGH_AS_1065 TaxID=3041795 RepID=UPI0027827FF7|nr:hypothetical protein [Siphonobacter sp. SORGH_AS_1065]MDQ1087182.1 hypothetical protein [Siphonobacter sp. SORGH_AS_1065]
MTTEPDNFVFIEPLAGTNQVEIKMTLHPKVEPVLQQCFLPDLEPEISMGSRQILESGKIEYQFRMSLLRATLVEGLFTPLPRWPGYWNYLLN